jgi:predicted ATPase
MGRASIDRIVLTGGPGAGKTTLTRLLADARPDRFVRVPEAATQVYEMLQTRWDRLDLAGRQDVQRRIYHLQVEQEARTLAAHPGKVLLLDRGTIDGAAYWPGGAEDYWRDLGTTHSRELARYGAVIWMQSCAAIGLYDGDSSNPCRFEDAEAAVVNGDKLKHFWSGHPNLHFIDAYPKVEEKLAAVGRVVENLLAGR